MTKKRHHSGPKIQRLLVDYVVKHFDYFREHPSHLAWAMMWYSGIDRTWRIKRGWDNYMNPKDYLLDMQESHGGPLNQADADLLYDAWGVTVDNYQVFNDAPPGLGSKRNKTLDEWVEYKTSPQYPHRDLYRGDVYRIWDHLLNTIGNGMDWNKDGFICDDGPSGVDEAIYSGYTRCEKEVEEKYRKGVLRYVDMMAARRDIGKAVYQYVKKAIRNNERIHAGEDYFEVLDPDRNKRMCEHIEDPQRREAMKKMLEEFDKAPKAFKKKATKTNPIRLYPFSDKYSCLCTMPDNAHESYIKAGIELCEMLLDGRAEISASFAPGEKEKYPDYDKEQKKLAKKFLEKWRK